MFSNGNFVTEAYFKKFLEKFGAELGRSIRKELAPLRVRIDSLEARLTVIEAQWGEKTAKPHIRARNDA